MALQRARGDPLAGLSTLLGAERRNYWGGRCGKERPAGMGSARRQSRLERGKVLLPHFMLASRSHERVNNRPFRSTNM
jgi:hypothetical protein